MKAKIVRERCTGCGGCKATCPEVFEMWNGAASVRLETVPAMAEGLCVEAMWNCRHGAIRVRELAGGLFPRWTSCEQGRGVALGYPGMIWCAPVSVGRLSGGE